MTLRWLIRSFAITLLMFCLSLWAWSYFHSIDISYDPSPGKHYFVETYMGGFLFLTSSNSVEWSPGWQFKLGRAFEMPDLWGNKRFLGFVDFDWATEHGAFWGFGISFWFLSLLSAGLLWFVWRQTRMKMTGRGFPVEVTQTK